MEDKSYQLASGTMTYTLGFEQGKVYCELFRRMKECRLDQVTKVVQKKTSLGMGDEMSFCIHFTENGKEEKFPWVTVLLTSTEYKEFFNDLKRRTGSQVIWEDKLEKGAVDKSGAKVFDMQCLPTGYTGAGLSRGVQIWMYMLVMGVLIIPFFYFLIILVKGGFRLYASDSGLEIRKLSGRVIRWEEIKDVTFQEVRVTNHNNFQTTQVSKVRIHLNSGKKRKFVMRYDHVIPFMKELVARGVLEEEMVGKFL